MKLVKWFRLLFQNNPQKLSEVEHYLAGYIKKNTLIFDVGAYVGSKTYLFATMGARVIAIEPQIELAEKLKRNFQDNHKIEIIQAALGKTIGELELSICDNRLSISTLSPSWLSKSRFKKEFTWNRTQKVKVLTLDYLIKAYGLPIFCKIDVEGFESEVLKGLHVPLPLVSFEFNKEILNVATHCAIILEKLGNYHFNASFEETGTFMSRKWTNASDIKKVILDSPYNWGDIYARLIDNRA